MLHLYIINYGQKCCKETCQNSAPINCMYILSKFVMWPPKQKPSQPTTCTVISGQEYLN